MTNIEQRTAGLLDALDGTGVDLTSDTLVDDVIAAGNEHQKVSQFLVSLPGYPSDPAEAIRQLEHLADMTSAAASKQASAQRQSPGRENNV